MKDNKINIFEILKNDPKLQLQTHTCYKQIIMALGVGMDMEDKENEFHCTLVVLAMAINSFLSTFGVTKKEKIRKFMDELTEAVLLFSETPQNIMDAKTGKDITAH